MEHSHINRKRNVIIAIPTPSFAEGLKKRFENEGLNVLEVCVVVDHLLERLHELKSEPSIKLDGIVISSAITKRLSHKRLELLADVIEKIREEFSDTSIIFLSDVSQGHPLLAELVSMGIYNIFVKSAKSEQLNIKQLIQCIDHPMLYHEAKKYRDYDKSIPWRRSFVNGANSITINIEGQEKGKTKPRSSGAPEIERQESNEEIKQLDNKTTKHQVAPKDPFPNILEEDLEEEEFLWQLPPIKPKIIVQDRIVGKSVIAVAGVEKGVGTTHASILIANYLASKGYSVKLIECSGKSEFVYIERAYEGKNVDTHISDEFEINGVTYVKADSEMDMANHVTSEHSHIVLDLGSYEETEYFDEYHRADKQFLVAPGGEWKQYTIKRFIQTNRSVDQTRWIFLIPMVDQQTISDIRGENEYIPVYQLPFHPDPFRGQTETHESLDHIFDSGQARRVKKTGKKHAFLISGVLVVGLVIFFIFR